ncbi:MAG: hypothetical protein ISS33_04665 [Candidatus Omnitrophica bacterium]|nr:hypothetical protein [Candidatus Omnitrophota bacterium]
MKKVLLGVVICCMVLIAHNGECRPQDNLYKMFSKKDQVKVFVHDAQDKSNAQKVDLRELRQEIEDALILRKSINFEVVSNKAEADIVIDCKVKEFVWMEEDPLDNVHGVVDFVADAVMIANYARLQAIFTVKDASSGKVLWKRTIKATLTEKDMDEAKSMPMANERAIKVFIRKCFAKPHDRS